MTSILEQTATDAIVTDLASHACMYGDPAATDHDHDACYDAPGAALANHLWAMATAAAGDDWKAVRVRLRRMDQAIGAGELP